MTQFATMMSFVRAGVGIAIVPSGAIAGFLGKDLAVLKLTKPRLSRAIVFGLLAAFGPEAKELRMVAEKA